MTSTPLVGISIRYRQWEPLEKIVVGQFQAD